MAGVWKRDGTVAVTNGNKKVTGTGTTFADTKNGVAKGHLFCITSGTSVDFYEVDYVVSNTELYLVQAYRGITATGKAYEIITTFSDSVPEFARRLTTTLGAYQQQSDAFQALLTSNAATIEVTAPDGTKQTLIPWKRVTSEGEGQTARAKAEADRAKTEADRALSEADRAAGIVAAAALPLPDVWAPLSDSLRLIIGYGRDVLVGSDVVARMVNFSRSSTATYIGKDGSLKTAAANEPRFEKEGLLIEGQSSNLISTSTSFKNASAGVSYETVSNPLFPHTITRVMKPSGNGDVWTNNAELIAGTVYTASIYIDKSGVNAQAAVYYGSNSTAASLVRSGVVVGGLEKYSATFTCQVSGAHQIRLGAYAAAFDFVAGCPQIEPLPFASSYIPTNGAAVTRAADQAWLPALGNRFVAGTYAVAFEFDLLGKVPGNALHRLIDFDNSGGSDRQHLSINDANALILTMGSPAVAVSVAGSQVGRAAFRMGNYMASVMFNGIAGNAGAVQGVGSSVNNRIVFMNTNIFNIPTYGHIRNLRMWSKHPISNDQLRTAA